MLSEKRRAETAVQRNTELQKRIEELSKMHHTAAQETVQLRTELRRRAEEVTRLKEEHYHANVTSQRSQQTVALREEETRRKEGELKDCIAAQEREIRTLTISTRSLKRENGQLMKAHENMSEIQARLSATSSELEEVRKSKLALAQSLSESRLKIETLEGSTRVVEELRGELKVMRRNIMDLEIQCEVRLCFCFFIFFIFPISLS